MKTKIAIAEDDPVSRRQYQQRFSFYDNLEITAIAGSGKELLETLSGMAEKRMPEVILLDIEMPELNGIETAGKISELYPSIGIIMLTVFKDEEKIFQSVKAGASGYLLKDSSTAEIVEAIDEIMMGGVPLSRSIARKVLEYMRQESKSSMETDNSSPAENFNLSSREIEILTSVVNDKTEAEIAEALFISQHTVRTHVKNIYKKLQVHTRGAVVKAAYKFNLIPKK